MKTKKAESYERREQSAKWSKKLTPLLAAESLQDERLELWELAGTPFLGFSYCWLDNQYGAEYRWVAVDLWHNRSIQDFESVGEEEAGQFVEYCESKFGGMPANG